MTFEELMAHLHIEPITLRTVCAPAETDDALLDECIVEANDDHIADLEHHLAWLRVSRKGSDIACAKRLMTRLAHYCIAQES